MQETIPVFFPPLGGPAAADIEAARALLAKHDEAVAYRKRSALVKCTSQIATGKGCGATHEVSTLEYIQTHWEHMSQGGHWSNRQGEGQWLCPSCGHRNRLYGSPDVEALKPHFRSVIDTYDK